MPRIARKEFDAAAEKVGQDRPRTIKSTGPARKAIEPALIETVDRPVDKDWADQMAFNEEPVRVLVHESTDKNAELIVEVYNNGVPQRFIRGQAQVVKRKFLEVLARAKMTTQGQQLIKDGEGNDTYRMVPHTALRYPFSVMEDSNPRGADWLKAVLAEA